MSIKSTFWIDRETALEVIRGSLDGISNDDLAKMLEWDEEISYLRNYWVVDTLTKDGNFTIKTVKEFYDI